MTRRSSSQGFTVLEVLVACAIGIVILVLLSDLFIQALQRTQDGRLRVDMQQRALFTINRWERDIEKTSQRAMVVKPGAPFCIALTQSVGLNGSAMPVWDDKIVCWAFLKEKKELQRETYPPESKTPKFAGEPSQQQPYLPTYSELDSLTTQVSGEEKIMCDNVEDFSLTDRYNNPTPREQPLVLRLKLRRPLSTSQRFADFSIERRYTLRNNF